MPAGRAGLSKLLVGPLVSKLAGGISKEDFLAQLKDAWTPHVHKSTPIEYELQQAMYRVNKSGPFKAAFDRVQVTGEDVLKILEEIRQEKIDPVKLTEAEKLGRNEPCWCGSNLKYKKCHGK